MNEQSNNSNSHSVLVIYEPDIPISKLHAFHLTLNNSMRSEAGDRVGVLEEVLTCPKSQN